MEQFKDEILDFIFMKILQHFLDKDLYFEEPLSQKNYGRYIFDRTIEQDNLFEPDFLDYLEDNIFKMVNRVTGSSNMLNRKTCRRFAEYILKKLLDYRSVKDLDNKIILEDVQRIFEGMDLNYPTFITDSYRVVIIFVYFSLIAEIEKVEEEFEEMAEIIKEKVNSFLSIYNNGNKIKTFKELEALFKKVNIEIKFRKNVGISNIVYFVDPLTKEFKINLILDKDLIKRRARFSALVEIGYLFFFFLKHISFMEEDNFKPDMPIFKDGKAMIRKNNFETLLCEIFAREILSTDFEERE